MGTSSGGKGFRGGIFFLNEKEKKKEVRIKIEVVRRRPAAAKPGISRTNRNVDTDFFCMRKEKKREGGHLLLAERQRGTARRKGRRSQEVPGVK